jgi:hypothetical protein
MKKSDLHILDNPSGKKTVHLRDFFTKNHRAIDNSKSTEALIVESGGDNCPVTIIQEYLKHLQKENIYLWQKPNSKTFRNTGIWYHNMKVGENTIASMMKKICQVCSLSTQYTNHSVRATSITILGNTFGDNDVRSVSGHKSLNCLGIYKRTSSTTLEAMSEHLHKTLNSVEDSETVESSRESTIVHLL